MASAVVTMNMDPNNTAEDDSADRVSPGGPLPVLATLLLPYGIMVGLILGCVTADESSIYHLEAMVKVSGAQRGALIAHTAYFFGFGFMEVMFNIPLAIKLFGIGKVPKKPDNLFWWMTCVGGELFFVGTAIYLLMACCTNVPRWTLLLPLAQVSYNLKNDIVWVPLGKWFSPIGKPIPFFILDSIIIITVSIIYINHFFNAERAY